MHASGVRVMTQEAARALARLEAHFAAGAGAVGRNARGQQVLLWVLLPVRAREVEGGSARTVGPLAPASLPALSIKHLLCLVPQYL